MHRHVRFASRGFLLTLLTAALFTAVPAGSQYLYLDTNGNGVRDPDDRIAAEGPTFVDVWLVTDRNRDGTPAICDRDAGVGLTMNSYSFALHVAGGAVEWGPMQNRVPFSDDPVCFATYADTTDSNNYYNGWGWSDIFPPGTYHLATLEIQRTSGTPSLFVVPFVPDRPTQITQFGTRCDARDWDNTYKLGLDWNDADGLGSTIASASGPYRSKVARAVTFDASGSRTPDGSAMTYRWDFGDGATAEGLIVTHTYSQVGDFPVTLVASSAAGTDTDVTTAHIVEYLAPIAVVGGPYAAYRDRPVTLDGRRSYDPDGYPLTSYSWDFGDGTQEHGAVVTHTYRSAGTFTIRLAVSNGRLDDVEETTIAVRDMPHPPVARAGGPYHGIVGRTVEFSGATSFDPDSDPLSYVWQFGDGTSGLGVISWHVYTRPGDYVVRLTVSDGYLAASTETSVSIAAALAARAFVPGGGVPTILLDALAPLTVHVEPVDDSFDFDEIDSWSIRLHAVGTGVLPDIPPPEPAVLVEDSDGNQVDELTATFVPEDLTHLLGGITTPTHLTLTVEGTSYRGGSFRTSLAVFVRPTGGGGLRVRPNPFNPVATVTFATSKPGEVRAHLFDVRGRRVRTILEGVRMEAGPHMLTLDARDGAGNTLASGTYFLRLHGPDGVTTRRVTVAK